MAEIKTGIFAKNVQKRLNRAQEKVLQKLGKADETKDEQFEQVVVNFRRQESEGSRLQREMKSYMASIKGMQQASINLAQSLHEVYEPDWHGKDDVLTIGKDCDAMWEDFHNKLVDSTLLNLDGYLQQFPDLKTRVAKRSRKLIDYDSARHHMETLQLSGMKNDRKMMKAEDELRKAQRVFDEFNVGLQNELPSLWDSRVGFYISTFKCITNLEARFHREISLVCRQLYEVMTKLGEQHSDKMFTIQGAPSDSGPLRLARTPSPPEDESPPESPVASSNHMLRPVSPGPPRPKSPVQLRKGPPVPPPPKATPTKEVAEEQIIDLFGGEFLPAPSPSQRNERPGESLLDLDFDAFQPDETVSPIPQTAIPWDMWTANSKTDQPDPNFAASWSADFLSIPVNGAASGSNAPTVGQEGAGGGAQAVIITSPQDSEVTSAAEDEHASRDEYSDRRQSTPGLIFTNEYGELMEGGTGDMGDKWNPSLDGSGSEYETAEEWAEGGQGGGWASAEELSYEGCPTVSDRREEGTFNSTLSSETQGGGGFDSDPFAETQGVGAFDSVLSADTQGGGAFDSDLFAETQGVGAFDSVLSADTQGGGAFDSDPFAETKVGDLFDSVPAAETQGGGAFDSDPFAETQGVGAFDSVLSADTQGGGAFDSDPFAETQGVGAFDSVLSADTQGGGAFDSDPFAETKVGDLFDSVPAAETQGGGAFDSDPFAETQGVGAFDSVLSADTQRGGAFDSDPFAETKVGDLFDSVPAAETQGGGVFDSDPFAETQGVGAFDSVLSADTQGGGAFDSDPFAETKVGDFFDSVPSAETQGGGAFASFSSSSTREAGAFDSVRSAETQGGEFDPDPFAETQGVGAVDSDPFAETQGLGAFDSDPFAERQGGGVFDSDPFAETQGVGAFDSDPFVEAQAGGVFDSDPFAETQGVGAFDSDPFAETQGVGAFDSDPFAETQGVGAFDSDPFAETQGVGAFESDPFAGTQGGVFDAVLPAETQKVGAYDSVPPAETQGGDAFDSDTFSAETQGGGLFVSDTLAATQRGGGDGLSERDTDPCPDRFPVASWVMEVPGSSTSSQQESFFDSPVPGQKSLPTSKADQVRDANIPRVHKEPENSDMSEDEAANRRLGKLYQDLDPDKEEVTDAFNGFSQDPTASSFFADFDKMNEAKKEASEASEIIEVQEKLPTLPAEEEPKATQAGGELEEPAAPPSGDEAKEPAASPTTIGEVEEPVAPPPTVGEVEEPAAPPPTVVDVEEPAAAPPTVGEVEEPAAPPTQVTEMEEPAAPPPKVIEVEEPAAPPPTVRQLEEPAAPPPTVRELEEPTAPPPTEGEVEEPEAPPPTEGEVEEPAAPPAGGGVEEPTALPTGGEVEETAALPSGEEVEEHAAPPTGGEVEEPVAPPTEGEVEETAATPADEELSGSLKEESMAVPDYGAAAHREEAPSEKMEIPSVVIEPASSNEGDDDRDADIISPTAISDNDVTAGNQTMKHMSPSAGGSGLPVDFLYKVETMHDFEAANSDELELKRGDVVLVVPTASVEDQDAGWLTGIKESDWLSHGSAAPKGLFPENFIQHLE